MDNYLLANVFRRGHIFQCESCRNSDWYSIDELSQVFICKRCQKDQKYLFKHWREGDEPVIYYQLNEMFYQGYKHNMIAPVLTLAYLKRNTSRSFLFVPEVQVINKSNPTDKFEIDILCIQDGKLVIGESKIGNDLNSKQFDKYKSCVEKLRAIFLYSTLTDDCHKVKTLASKSKLSLTPIFLTRQDIFNY